MEDSTGTFIRVSIVVPVYRSAAILPTLVEQILSAMLVEGMGDSFELVLVHDAGPDKSWEIIQQLAQQHAFIRGINLRKNAGQHNAIMAGLNHVRGETVVIMDDDLQHPPAAVAEMIRAVEGAHDVCYTRYKTDSTQSGKNSAAVSMTTWPLCSLRNQKGYTFPHSRH